MKTHLARLGASRTRECPSGAEKAAAELGLSRIRLVRTKFLCRRRRRQPQHAEARSTAPSQGTRSAEPRAKGSASVHTTTGKRSFPACVPLLRFVRNKNTVTPSAATTRCGGEERRPVLKKMLRKAMSKRERFGPNYNVGGVIFPHVPERDGGQ